MCKVLRSFMPVGQGSFCVEQFVFDDERINLVFDCGSSTDMELLHNNIDDIFQTEKTIHAVFISHLHEDHINGLEYLLSKYRVKNIYFPLLNNNEKILTLVNYLYSKPSHKVEDFFFRFISNPREYLNRNDLLTNIYYVLPSDHEPLEYREQFYDLIESGKNVAKDIKEISSNSEGWEIVPFNFRNKERTIDLTKKLEKVFIKHFPYVDIHIDENFDLGYYWQNYPCIRYDIKKAYEYTKGSLNTNSMVVFSGTTGNARQNIYSSRSHNCYRSNIYCRRCYKSGCLYTGDYDCSGKNKFNELIKAYASYWDSIGCITIPHHGSQHNYNKQLTENEKIFCIISASMSNNYKHPHALVLRDLLNKRILTFWVNENIYSKVQTYIY